MAGEFNRAVLPALAGDYFNWEAEVTPTPAVGLGGVVALVGSHDWGTVNSLATIASPDDWLAKMGPSDTAAKRATFDAFRGEGLPGKSGASQVLFYRAATGAAAAAALILLNTAPASGITLTARFPGTFANALRATIQPGVAGGTKELLILRSGRVIARYVHTSTALAALVADINASDGYVSAVLNADGVALADVAAASLAGGNDGAVLTGTQHAAAQAALANVRFAWVAPVALTDGAIRSAYQAWEAEQNTLGKRFFLAVGGAAAELLSTANTRSRAFNDYNVVNLGAGTLHDDALGVDVSTADLAPRFAGAMAGRGERKDGIYMRFAGLSVPASIALPSLVEQESALDAGTTVFSRDTFAAAPVFIREAVTTYADDSASAVDVGGNKLKPVWQYKRIKNLAIQHGVENAVDAWATSGNILGDLPNNERARGLILGRVAEEYATREVAEIVQPGWTVTLDPSIPQTDDDDFVAYLHGFHPTRSLRQMLNTVRMG